LKVVVFGKPEVLKKMEAVACRVRMTAIQSTIRKEKLGNWGTTFRESSEENQGRKKTSKTFLQSLDELETAPYDCPLASVWRFWLSCLLVVIWGRLRDFWFDLSLRLKVKIVRNSHLIFDNLKIV